MVPSLIILSARPRVTPPVRHQLGRVEDVALTLAGCRRGRAGRRATANVIDPLREMVLAGAGIAVLPDYLVHDHLASGARVAVLDLETEGRNAQRRLGRQPVPDTEGKGFR